MSRGIFLGTIASQRPAEADGGVRNITSVFPVSSQTVDYGTLYSSLVLPSSVNVTLDDATQSSLPVVWAQGSYDSATAGTYVLIGTITLLTGIINTTNITASISITVSAAVTFDYYADVTRPNDTGNGLTPGTAKKTILAAIALANAAATSSSPKTVFVAAGTYTETNYILLNPYVSMVGAGVDLTIIKGASSLNFTYTNYNWSLDKSLIQLRSGTLGAPSAGANGNQTLRAFTVDGDNRAKHIGIYVGNRHNVTIQEVKITKFNFSGLWNIGGNSCKLIDVISIDNSRTANDFSSGAIMMSTCDDMEISGMGLNEGRGYGVKAFGPPGPGATFTVRRLKIHDSSFSVIPTSDWGGGTAPNIAVEIHDVFAEGIEIYNNNIDNTTSVVTNVNQANTYQNGATVATIYNNVFDMMTRANGSGYPLETACHNVVIRDNYMWGGANAGIVSWNSADTGRPSKDNWLVYNNVFYDQQAFFPSVIVRSRYTGLNNLRFYNNTIHIVRNAPVYIFQLENGNDGQNWTIRNNIVIDESTADSPSSQGGANQFINLSSGSTLQNLIVSHNYVSGMPIGSISGGTYTNNSTANPQLVKSGLRPTPYYRPAAGSPLINAGINVGLPFSGSAPTIGRYELSSGPSTVNIVSVAAQTDVTVSTGVAFSALNLPTSVTVTLSNSSTQSLPVVWAQGSYNSSVSAVYTLTGTITLVSGITNTNALTASVSVVVGSSNVIFTDSFDRLTLGSNYTIEQPSGTLSVMLDGSNMQFDGPDGNGDQRILRLLDLEPYPNIRITMVNQVVEYSATSYGLGIGIQNAVNPNPNKGVHLNFHLSSAVEDGILWIYSGNGDTANHASTIRATSSTQLAVALGNIYEIIFERNLVNGNAVFTASARNTSTGASISTTWTEVGAGSLSYANTSKIAIYHFGGLQQVNSLTVQNLTVQTAFPNVVSVQAVSPITVANGTAFGSNGAGVGLPSTRTVTLDNGSTPTYNIAWNIGSYNPTAAGSYTITGTIQLPSGVTNSNNVIATASVTVQAVASTTTFTYYVSPSGNDSNGGTIGSPFRTIQRAANVATAGQSVGIRAGTYRETVIPANQGTSTNPITFAAYPGETVVINGCDLAGDTGWTAHDLTGGRHIYKKSITLPVSSPTMTLTSNTTIMANQVFKSTDMIFEARWPKVSSMDDLFDKNKLRPRSSTTSWSGNQLNDSGLPLAAPGLNGGRIWQSGWYLCTSGNITGHSGTTLTTSGTATAFDFQQYYFVTGKLALLTQEKEWHYDPGTLYVWQAGGGSPTGIEYKARNWGFDLRGKSYITITGVRFHGCEPMTGDTGSNSIVLDNIRAKYTNHTFHLMGNNVEYANADTTGIKLIGSNCVIKNSEIQYTAAQGVWAGSNCRVENNLFLDIDYQGGYTCAIMPYASTGGQVITRNTVNRCGRSAIDFNGLGLSGQHLGMDISYNDLSRVGALNVDLGAIYGSRGINLTGTRIHHNWIHDSLARLEKGIHTGMYLDQAAGPVIFDHNVCWNNLQAEFFNQQSTSERPMSVGSLVYNNTFGTVYSNATNGFSYVTYTASPNDVLRNNICRHHVNFAHGVSAGNQQNDILRTVDPLFVGPLTTGLGYRLQSGSPARGGGVSLPPYTNNVTDGNVDRGAYEFGEDWVPGYVAVPYEQDETPPGTGNIASLGTINNIFVPYNTAFGTNGAGVGLPSSVSCVFDGGATGTVNLTWAIGSYSQTAARFDDIGYTIVGTPVTGGGITNTGAITKSVTVTVRDMFHPLTSAIALVVYPKGLVTNTSNSYGVVNASNDITSLKSIAPGPLGRDFSPQGTAPKLSGGKAVFVGTGCFLEDAGTTNFGFMSHNVVPADLKFSVFSAINVTDVDQLSGIVGNNGFWGPNDGVAIVTNTTGSETILGLLITGNDTHAIEWYASGFTPGTDIVLGLQINNALPGASGKVRGFINATELTATATGTGVFDSAPAPAKLTIGDILSYTGVDMLGTISMMVILQGVESDAVRAKLISDIAAAVA